MLSMEAKTHSPLHTSPAKLFQVSSIETEQVASALYAIKHYAQKHTVIFALPIRVSNEDCLTGRVAVTCP